MSIPIEFGPGFERDIFESEVVELFQAADKNFKSKGAKRGAVVLQEPYKLFCERYSYFDFADLEEIFRKHNFSTHFLAVPADRFEQPIGRDEIVFDKFPGQHILDVYQKMVNNKDVPMPYRGIAYASLEDAKKAASAFDMEYDQKLNLTMLRLAGGRFVTAELDLPDRIKPSKFVPGAPPKIHIFDSKYRLLGPHRMATRIENASIPVDKQHAHQQRVATMVGHAWQKRGR